MYRHWVQTDSLSACTQGLYICLSVCNLCNAHEILRICWGKTDLTEKTNNNPTLPVMLTLYVLIFSEGTKTYIYILLSFLHIDMTQVVEILPQVRQGPTYST